MKRVLAMGNALVDILIRIDDDEILSRLGFPRGSMILVDKEQMNGVLDQTSFLERIQSTGGSAANMITGLARLGASTGYIGKLGRDEFGSFFEADMKKNGIKAALFTAGAETGKCVSLISRDSERTMATYLGAAVELDASDLHIDLFKGYDYFHLEGYLVQNYDLVRRAVALAREAGNEVAVDLSSFNVVAENRDFLEPLVEEYVDIVFANEEEARSFTDKDDPREALEEIARKCKLAVVKIGAEGSLIKDGKNLFQVPAIKACPLDTTGAGDLYAAGFYYGLTGGYPLDICGQIGSITAGKVVEVIGARMDEQKWQEVESLIKRTIEK